MIDNLIDYLDMKGKEINNEFFNANYQFKELGRKGKITDLIINDELQTQKRRQNSVLKILSYIKELHSSRISKTNEVLIYSEFILQKAKEIVNGAEKFDSHHPLYGFQPFHDKLIEEYSRGEKFEKCIEIQNANGK